MSIIVLDWENSQSPPFISAWYKLNPPHCKFRVWTGRSPDHITSFKKNGLVNMALVAGLKVILKMKDVHVGIGEVVSRSTNHGSPRLAQVFVTTLRVDCSIEQLVIDFLDIRVVLVRV